MMNRKDSRTPRRDPSSVKNWIYRRGDIYLVNFDPVIGSEQGGLRPALILQNDVGNYFSSTTVVVPITSHIKKLLSNPETAAMLQTLVSAINNGKQ